MAPDSVYNKAFADYAQRYHIKFEIQRLENHVMISFDPVQMEKVFFNIFSNAFNETSAD